MHNFAVVHADLGLFISEEKFSLGMHLVLEWPGFVRDTAHFCLFVTDKKIRKAAALVSELSSSTGQVAIEWWLILLDS